MEAAQPMATPPEPARPAPPPVRPATGLREAAADPANWGLAPAALARRLGLAPPTYAETLALLGKYPRLGTRAGHEVAAFVRAVVGHARESPSPPEWFDAYAEAHRDLVEATRSRGSTEAHRDLVEADVTGALSGMIAAIPAPFIEASCELASLYVSVLNSPHLPARDGDPDRDPYCIRLESVANRALELAAGLAPGRELWALDALDVIDRRRAVRRRVAGTDASSHWWVRHEEACGPGSGETFEYRHITDAARLLFRSRERDAARVRAACGLAAPESYAHLAAIERRAGRRFDPLAAFADPRWRHLPVPPRLVEAAAALAAHDACIGRGRASAHDLAGVLERNLAHVRVTLPHLNFDDAPIVVPEPPQLPGPEIDAPQARPREVLAAIDRATADHIRAARGRPFGEMEWYPLTPTVVVFRPGDRVDEAPILPPATDVDVVFGAQRAAVRGAVLAANGFFAAGVPYPLDRPPAYY